MLQPKIKEVKPLADMKLQLIYETNEIKVFDVKPYASGAWYEELNDIEYFKKVRLVPDGIGIEWPDGQDISPHELYERSCSIT